MKIPSFGMALLILAALQTRAQSDNQKEAEKNAAVANLPRATAHEVKEIGAHHRVWQRTEYEIGLNGQAVPRVHQFIELATGMNYQNEHGQWLESSEAIESFPGGAVARQGQHKLLFANDLASAGAIDMETPEGLRMRSHILGLSYFDTASGKSVFIAEVTNCQGVVINGNQVLYENAFDNFNASVLFTYRKDGFEQDVILKERPPLPEDYELDSRTTHLQVLTEFLFAPEPVVRE